MNAVRSVINISLGLIIFLSSSVMLGMGAAPRTTYYQKRAVGDDQNRVIRYASMVSGNDIDFISTVETENGTWAVDRVSGWNTNGTRDYGICQINNRYHKAFIHSPEFKDYTKQVEYCWKLYKDRKTAFYGYFRRRAAKSKFYLTY